jgi:hypothetical protein
VKAVVVFFGPVLGGICGVIALTMAACLTPGAGAQCGLIGIFGGFPLGAIVGGIFSLFFWRQWNR